MCFYYAVLKVDVRKLVANKIIKEKQLELFKEEYIVSGYNFPQMPVISNEDPENIQLFNWGLVPPYTRSKEKAREFLQKYNTLNAKTETIFSSKVYGNSIRKKRCLVLCSGFFEWRHKEPGKKSTPKYPFYVTLKDESMFVFAGVWEEFTDETDGEIVRTYSVLTTEANELVSIVHNNKKRMPLILDPDRAMEWLSEDLSDEKIKSFFKPFDADKMKARPIAKINPRMSESYNNPGVNAYYEYGELKELLEKYPHFFEQSADLR